MVAIFHLGGKTQPILNYGWLGVQLFFVLSGFIICWALPITYHFKNSITFLWKRIVRIHPPYLMSISLVILLNILNEQFYHPDWQNIALHFGFMNNFFHKPYLNPVYWTLGIEFQFYVFVAFTIPIILSKWGKWFVLTISFAGIFIPYLTQTLFNHFSLFGVGIICYLFRKELVSRIAFIFIQISLLLLIAINMDIAQSFAALLACLLLLTNLPENKIVTFFAKISFSLYLIHDIIGSNLVVYLGTLFHKSMASKAGMFCTGMVVSIIAAYIFYLYVEKPLIKYAKQFSYRNE